MLDADAKTPGPDQELGQLGVPPTPTAETDEPRESASNASNATSPPKSRSFCVPGEHGSKRRPILWGAYKHVAEPEHGVERVGYDNPYISDSAEGISVEESDWLMKRRATISPTAVPTSEGTMSENGLVNPHGTGSLTVG